MNKYSVHGIGETCHNVSSHSGKFEVDQFQSSEFFFDNGVPLRDYQVTDLATGDPVLAQKMREYLVENDVKAFDTSVSDDDVFNSLQSKYLSSSSILSSIKSRIRELRNNPVVESASEDN